MQPQLRKFILYSLLVHLCILALFSFQNQSPPIELPLEVTLTEKKRSSSASSQTQSSSQSANAATTPNPTTEKFKSFNNQVKTSKPNNTATAKSTPSPKPVQANTVIEKVNDPTPTSLVRNTPRANMRSVNTISDTSSLTDNRLTLNDSKDLARGVSAASAANAPSKNDGGRESGFGSGTLGVQGGNNVAGDGAGFSLNRDSVGGGAATGNYSPQNTAGGGGGQGNDNLNWKGTGQRSLISRDDLVFPNSLKGKGIDEEVVVAFNVSPEGRVFDIEVVKSSGYPELDSAVKDQVRSFRFNPVKVKKNNSAEYSYLFNLTEKK